MSNVLYRGRWIGVTHLYKTDAEGWRIVFVDARKFDKAWQRDGIFYLASGEGAYWGKRIDELIAYNDALPRWEKREQLKVPIVFVDDNGVASFQDGRHRYAFFRDAGCRKIPVSMNPQSRANARLHGYVA
jgi:hypothetical protein